MKDDAVLYFRAESTCQFQGHLYIASDEPKGEIYPFPAGLLYDVPQHFTAVQAGYTPPDREGNRLLLATGPNEEAQDLRDKFFVDYFVINRDGSKSEAQRHAETADLKANYVLYGQATPPAPKAPEDMSKAELGDALKALGFEAPAAMSVADRLAKLVELQKAGA